jgi:hypothetical protein
VLPSYATSLQPSLSQQIQKLEGELGERLFDRMKRVAKLTPHGETFLKNSRVWRLWFRKTPPLAWSSWL